MEISFEIGKKPLDKLENGESSGEEEKYFAQRLAITAQFQLSKKKMAI